MGDNGESVAGPDPWVQLVAPITGEIYYENSNLVNEITQTDKNYIFFQNTLFFISGFLSGVIVGILIYKFFFFKKLKHKK